VNKHGNSLDRKRRFLPLKVIVILYEDHGFEHINTCVRSHATILLRPRSAVLISESYHVTSERGRALSAQSRRTLMVNGRLGVGPRREKEQECPGGRTQAVPTAGFIFSKLDRLGNQDQKK
jgi:hypothetical protein